jgi:hypothetical protein
MRFCAIFGLATRSAAKYPRRNADDGAARGLVRVNDAPMRRRILHRSGTGAGAVHDFKTTAPIAVLG